MNPTALHELDQLILADARFKPALFEGLLAAQRELGLLQGDRPTCPFLRPHILTRSRYETVRAAAQTIALAFERLAQGAFADPSLMKLLGLTPAEEEMARFDPGYERLCVTSRLDALLTRTGFQFLEYNAESPAGVGDQMQLEQVLFNLPHTKEFLEQHDFWTPQPHKQLLQSLISTYRESGGEEDPPQIAIVDWEGVATAGEFGALRQYFQREGYPAIITDPSQLHYDSGVLKSEDFRVDILYKRVIIHEFLARFDRGHPLARAYIDGRVCMVNSFRAKMVHKKAGFAILSDPRYSYLFDEQQLATIRQHIPWTRLVTEGSTTYEGVEQDLFTLLRDQQQRMVLKPNDDYGGHGVFLGWETEPDEWQRAIAWAAERPYVAQERVAVDRVSIPTFSDRVRLEEMFVDFNPFLFDNEVEGALVRLSNSSLLNITSGGGQTALVVLED